MNSTATYAPNLREKAISAGAWSLIDTGARQGFRFIVTLVLARILTPTDYGTVAILDLFISLAGLFISAGLPSALIQKRTVTDTDLSTVFYANIVSALLFASVLCAVSPWIARFYGIPVLSPLTCVLAGNLVLSSVGTIQSVLLARDLDVKTQCLVSAVVVPVSGGTAVALASLGFGVWSLAAQTLVGTALWTAAFWNLIKWRPRLVFSTASLTSLLRFGGFMIFANISDIVFTRLNSLVIGKFYSARDLGYYSRAEGTSVLPGNIMSAMITRVAFPVYAAASEDNILLRRGLRKAVMLVMWFNIPIMLGLALVAAPAVAVMFGPQWTPSVPYLRILCLAGVLWPLHVLNLNVLMAQGHSDLLLRLEFAKKGLGILLLGSACMISISAIAWATVIMGLFSFAINAYYSGKLLAYGCWRQTIDLLPYLGAGVVMSATMWAVALLAPSTPVLRLLIQLPVGGAMYLSACWFLRLEAAFQGWAILRNVLFGRRLAAARG